MKKTYALRYINPTNTKNINTILRGLGKMRDVKNDREYQLIVKYSKKVKKLWKSDRSAGIKGKFKLQRRVHRYLGLSFNPSTSIYKKSPKIKQMKRPLKKDLFKLTPRQRNRLLKKYELTKSQWKKYNKDIYRLLKQEKEYRKKNPLKNKKIKFDIKPEGVGVEVATFEPNWGDYQITNRDWVSDPENLTLQDFNKWVEDTRAVLNEFNAIIYQNDFLSGQYAGWIHRVMRALGVPVVVSTQTFLNDLKRWIF